VNEVDREPDYRFTLANERTFLAWVRTSLALLAGGVAIRFIAQEQDVEGGREALAVGAILLAAVTVVLAYRRWAGVQEAMRHDRPLPRSVGIPLLTVAIAGVAVAAAIVVIL
jgi:putative membrane protein